MNERPILFSAPMVRALLDGSKTQTRRALRVQPLDVVSMGGDKAGREWVGLMQREPEPKGDVFRCKFGQPGDRLWVRESFWGCDLPGYGDQPCVVYDDEWVGKEYQPALPRPWGRKFGRIPSIHMPRDCSRILLEIVSVRVERLNDISEDDAKAEGVMQLDAEDFERPMEHEKDGWKLCPKCYGTGLHSALGAGGGVIFDVDCRDCDTHAKLYRHLWQAINGPDSWAANPWVWAVEFKRVTP